MLNFIDGDFFESLSDFSFGDIYSNNILKPNYNILKSIFDKFENPILFIETHRLPDLLKCLEGMPQCKIIAHNSDMTYGKEILKYIPKNVTNIWCQNYNYIETDVVRSLPIGLERIRWFPEQKKQEVLMKKISEDGVRHNSIYMNFNPNTNPIRKQIYEYLKDKDFVNVEMVGNGGDYENYLNNLKSHKYVISPPGNGIDCHRTWEAIYCGCIPIVLDSYFVRNIFSELGVFIISSLEQINENLLQYNINKENKLKDWEKLIKK